MKETIHNSDLRVTFYDWKKGAPMFSHFEVEHFAPLKRSDNPIIKNLIESEFEIHETLSSYHFGFPRFEGYLANHFVAYERREYQINLEGDGCLRWRFEGEGRIYLSLFSIKPDRRGKGLARYWFPRVTEGLFLAGVNSMRGAVSPAHGEPKNEMNQRKLVNFYVREIGFKTDGRGWVWKDSPYLEKRMQNAEAKCSPSAASSMIDGCPKAAF